MTLTAPSTDRLTAHVDHLAEGIRDRQPTSTLESSIDYAAAHLRREGWVVHEQPINRRNLLTFNDAGRTSPSPLAVFRRHITGRNLLAVRPGQTGPFTVVGAHIDSVSKSPGADDNASAVAAVLELGTILPKETAESVCLALFDMEEIGLFGSKEATKHPLLRDNTRAMICLEMLGYYNSEPDTQRLPIGGNLAFKSLAQEIAKNENRGDFALVIHRDSSADLARRWSTAAIESGLPALTLRDPRRDGLAGILTTYAVPPLSNLDRSDHSPFWHAGIPSIMITDTGNLRNPHYHLPSDLPATLNFQQIARATNATARTLVDLASIFTRTTNRASRAQTSRAQTSPPAVQALGER